MIRVGFLHLGDSGDGVRRYGAVLAAGMRELAGSEDVAVIEAEGGTPAAGRALREADVVHFQYCPRLFGPESGQRRRVRRLLDELRRPVVFTPHDVYPRSPWAAWKKQRPTPLRRARDLWKDFTRRRPVRATLRLLLERCAAAAVPFRHEAAILTGLAAAPEHAARIAVVGHFIEERRGLPDRATAQQALGLAGRRVLTVLGFLHPRKGHDLALEALARLPDDVTLVFVGRPSPGHEEFQGRLERRAARLGLADRLRITGFVPEDALELHLAATDLALCPFRFFSASGSLATWLAADAPLLCARLPQIEEYLDLAPRALSTFERHEPETLAAAILAALARERGEDEPARAAGAAARARLRGMFALRAVVERHLGIYRAAAGGRRTPAPLENAGSPP